MAERIRFLVTYDIRHPRRLKRVHDVVVDHGERLQYSVYVCDLTRQEMVALRAALRKVMHLDEDHVAIFDLGPPQGRASRRVEHLGRAPKIPDEDEPAIW
ncbi:CRISPR-associated endonuclease Cas2 [Patulibacter defluvii]|uniref:CRISPR-associated endonuclease Cas2 n=1 Tax=Patulibacter defluvii TaxID=3095358 RepID=UPI002A74E851|nr:CRISPR-associated endonuclease Cas2 [Patulibacter sp. DM4]